MSAVRLSCAKDAVTVIVPAVTLALLFRELEDDRISGPKALPDVCEPLQSREAAMAAAASGAAAVIVSPALAARIAGIGDSVPFLNASPGFDPDDEDEAVFRHLEEGGELIAYGARIVTPDELAAMRPANASPGSGDTVGSLMAFADEVRVDRLRMHDLWTEIVVIESGPDGDVLVDGHHRAAAAILNREPLIAIDLSDPRGEPEPSPGW